jgi:multidrug transporter EmrE-like cation transporter
MANIKRFVKDYKMFFPFILNQSGSIVFYVLLSTEPISIASPVCNSLSFLFTAVTSYFIFNEVVKYPAYLLLGTVIIIIGTVVCMAD